ncbi:multidrug transporter [Pasteurellaceae bacterium Orientalotternb1]|nr:multidrug transporter [Pasteurellaceae bacterium Orientalotternb1]
MKLKKYGIALGLLLGGGYALYPDTYPIYPKSDHYSLEEQRFFNAVPDKEMDKIELLDALWQMVVHKEKFAPPAPLPTEQPDFSAFLANSELAKFVWFGHSSLLTRVNGQTIFIDPVFAQSVSPVSLMGERFQAPPASLSQLPPIDWIVLSHNHYDHLDRDVIEYYKPHKTGFIVPLGVGVLLQKWGIEPERIQELDWWQSTQVGELNITSVPAWHNTGRSGLDRNKTLWAGYVFQTSSEKIYYSGDSAFGDGVHFREIGERFGSFDVAFVENGQYNTTWIDNHMLPEQTAEAVSLVRAKRFVPVHWAAYALSIHPWSEPVERSIPLVEQAGISVMTPKIGQVFDQNTQTDKWWRDVK